MALVNARIHWTQHGNVTKALLDTLLDTFLTFALMPVLWIYSTCFFQVENEFKSEYEELSQQCKQFAKDLLDQTRSSRELEMILNYRDDINLLDEDGNNDLARLKLAIKYHQKEVSGTNGCTFSMLLVRIVI